MSERPVEINKIKPSDYVVKKIITLITRKLKGLDNEDFNE